MLNNGTGEYGKYIIQELYDPNPGSPEFQAMYKKFASRLLWVDSNVVDGAFQMNTAWYTAMPEWNPVFEEHVHDYDEMIGFIGSDPANPRELGGEMEVGIGGEMHVLKKSCLIFLPSGLKHMPLRIKRVDRPIFHFSVVMNREYTGGGAYK